MSILQNSFTNAKSREYHSRMQLFVLLFIEGSSYIEDDDEKWEIYTRYGCVQLTCQARADICVGLLVLSVKR